MYTTPLSNVNVKQLEAIFEEEIRCWRKELFWDYFPSVTLIKQFVSSRSLPGFALQNEVGAVAGYCYYVVAGPIGYIGNLYVKREVANDEAYHSLLRATFSALRSWGEVERIECQVFSFNCDLTRIFESLAFRSLKRYFLSLSVRKLDRSTLPAREADFPILSWESKFFTSAAEVIYDSYCDSADYQLCYDYQSEKGCLRFLRNLIYNPGSGTFNAEISYVILDQQDTLCAVLLTSKTSPETGMIP